MFTYRQKIKLSNLDGINLCKLYEEFEKLPEPDNLLRPSDCGLCIGCIENHIHGGMENCKGPPNAYRLWYSEIKGLLTVVKNNYNGEWGIMSTIQDNAWKELPYYWKPLKNTQTLSPTELRELSSQLEAPGNRVASGNCVSSLPQNSQLEASLPKGLNPMEASLPYISKDNYYESDYDSDYDLPNSQLDASYPLNNVINTTMNNFTNYK